MGDTAHVAAVIGRARAVALVGGGRANRGELIGVSRIAATGTSARHGASALVVALVVTARTSDSAEQRLQDQQEKNSQGQECAGYHLHWQPPFSARARDARPKTRGEIALVLELSCSTNYNTETHRKAARDPREPVTRRILVGAGATMP